MASHTFSLLFNSSRANHRRHFFIAALCALALFAHCTVARFVVLPHQTTEDVDQLDRAQSWSAEGQDGALKHGSRPYTEQLASVLPYWFFTRQGNPTGSDAQDKKMPLDLNTAMRGSGADFVRGALLADMQGPLDEVDDEHLIEMMEEMDNELDRSTIDLQQPLAFEQLLRDMANLPNSDTEDEVDTTSTAAAATQQDDQEEEPLGSSIGPYGRDVVPDEDDDATLLADLIDPMDATLSQDLDDDEVVDDTDDDSIATAAAQAATDAAEYASDMLDEALLHQEQEMAALQSEAAAVDALEAQELEQDLNELLHDALLNNLVDTITGFDAESAATTNQQADDTQAVVMTITSEQQPCPHQESPVSMLLNVFDAVFGTVAGTAPVPNQQQPASDVTEEEDNGDVDVYVDFDELEELHQQTIAQRLEDAGWYEAVSDDSVSNSMAVDSASQTGSSDAQQGSQTGVNMLVWWWSGVTQQAPVNGNQSDRTTTESDASGALLLAGLLLATAAMLMGFVKTFMQLKKAMHRELLVPFVMEHGGEVRHGYMLLDEEQLGQAAQAATTGSAWKLQGAVDVTTNTDDEKAIANAQWKLQQHNSKSDQTGPDAV